MKKIKKILALLLSLSAMLGGTFSSFAAGYEVVMEPSIEASGFSPTPFNKGVSVVHKNLKVVAGMFATYYGNDSYVLDIYGNRKDFGDYDCYGLYWWDFGNEFYNYYTEQMEKRYEVNVYEGVDQDGYISVAKNGKGGLIDTEGNVIIPCKYDDLYDAEELENVKSGNNIEVKAYTGKYYEAYFMPYYYYEYGVNYYNGLAVVQEKSEETAKVGIVDENDNIVVPFIYDMITACYDDACWVLKDGKWGTIAIDRSKVSVKLNGEEIEFDQIPLIINGRTLAPLRAIFEKLGAEVLWDDATRTIKATKDGTTVELTIDKKEMKKNGEAIVLDEAPQIISERTLVPVRAISEAFDCKVTWEAETHTVLIEK